MELLLMRSMPKLQVRSFLEGTSCVEDSSSKPVLDVIVPDGKEYLETEKSRTPIVYRAGCCVRFVLYVLSLRTFKQVQLINLVHCLNLVVLHSDHCSILGKYTASKEFLHAARAIAQ